MIVLDGRNDREKLHELLVAGEQTHLDYKARVDLSDGKARLDFVKDVVAMSNLPGGGYILIGVDDDGTPSLPAADLEARRFDGAELGQHVRKYIEGAIEVHPQVHEVGDGMVVVSVRVEGHRDGLPVPMAKDGQYPGPEGKSRTVFREGEVLVREGSANMTLRHAHWPQLLTEHDLQIREQAQRDSQELISLVVAQLRHPASVGPQLPPLAMSMDEATFAEAVLSHLESSSDVRLTGFINQARATVSGRNSDAEDPRLALDRLTVLATQALFVEREEWARAVVDAMRAAYDRVAAGRMPRRVEAMVEIITRVYAVGAMAVRMEHWALVSHIARQPVESSPGYTHSSWLRHAQVEGSRAGLFPANGGGLFISAARSFLTEHPAAHPDLLGSVVDEEKIDDHDEALNSLCQLDLAYCLVAVVEGAGRGRWYPACAAFHRHRSDPLYLEIAAKEVVRRALFVSATDLQIATAMQTVETAAENESWNFGGFWSSLPFPAQSFVDRQLS